MRHRVVVGWMSCLALGLVLGWTDSAHGETKSPAKLVSPTGSLVGRTSPEASWEIVEQNSDLSVGTMYVCAGDTHIDSANGAVQISLLEDLSDKESLTSSFPIIETGIVFEPSGDFDAKFVLDRGRVKMTNKSKKASRVHVTAGGEQWQLTLRTPGSEVAIETFGRWSCGKKFKVEPPPGYGPCQDVVVVVLVGDVDLKFHGATYALDAPPGASYVQWDNVSGVAGLRPQHLKQLPKWTKEQTTVKDKTAMLAFKKVAQEKGLEAAIEAMLQSDKQEQRTLGIYAAAALDDLEEIGKVLRTSKHPDLWNHAVLALRHWIGRKPGQDQKLYQGLIASKRYSPSDAHKVLHLLHDLPEDELEDPFTYELLIAYLNNDQLAIRGLAHWHLVRLVPGGAEIPYHPLDPPEKRKAAYKEWKKLVPSGKLPPKVVAEQP